MLIEIYHRSIPVSSLECGEAIFFQEILKDMYFPTLVGKMDEKYERRAADRRLDCMRE